MSIAATRVVPGSNVPERPFRVPVVTGDGGASRKLRVALVTSIFMSVGVRAWK